MLLKRAKKQKLSPYVHPNVQHAFDEKELQNQNEFADKYAGKLNAVEKTQRKCVKMLQKMVKQGKLPFDIVNALITPDKKLKDNLNPAVLLAGIPACPEKQQLEKLLRKRTKQRQKLAKQQLLHELNRRATEQTMLKSEINPKPITGPIVMRTDAFINEFAKENILDVSASMQTINSNTLVNTTINSINNQKIDAATIPMNELLPIHDAMDAKNVLDIKMLNELDRNKLNVFKKLTKQKNAKSPTSSSGLSESGVINLPSGTTITPAPAPPVPLASASTAVTASITSPQTITQLNSNNNNTTSNNNKNINNNNNNDNNDSINMNNNNNINLNHNINNSSSTNTNASNTILANTLFNNNHNNNSLLGNSGSNYAAVNLQSDDLNKNPLMHTVASGLTHPTNDLSASYSGRVFGEKTADAVDIVNKPKKRGRKPGSKNNPKLPGDLSLTPTSKKSKKTKYENNLFPPANLNATAALPPPAIANANHPTFNSINPFELNATREAMRPGGILPVFSMSGENPLQNQISMANAKERKERKKNKTSKTISNMNYMSNNNNNSRHGISSSIQQSITAVSSSFNINNNLCGNISDVSNIPTNEEVQSINKKLMRMDTTLKPAPLQTNDLNSAETSLMATTKFQSTNSTTNKLSFSNTAISNSSTELQHNSPSIKSPRSLNESVNHSPFIMPNQQFSHLPGNMLSMLPFPFPPRPGLIPTPGLFPNPNLGAFTVSNTKNNANTNMLLPGLFPFPLKQSNLDNGGKSSVPDVDTEDLTIENRKNRDCSTALAANERNYCNVAPLVPEYLKLTNSEMGKSSSMVTENYSYNNDLPRTPKARNSQSSNCNTPDSLNNNSFSSNSSSKSIPTTPGGISLSSYEHLLKKHDSPIEVIPLGPKYPSKQDNNNRHVDNAFRSNLMPMDFAAYKRSPAMVDNRTARITINADEPIEVSDDSDETNQNSNCNSMNSSHFPTATTASVHPSPRIQLSAFSRDNNFVNTLPTNSKLISVESELTTKELKKLKKHVKRASASASASAATVAAPVFCTNLLSVDKNADGVGKLAGGADLIPLSSTGLAYSSQSIPFNSLTGGNSNPTFGSHAKDLLTSKLGSSSGNSMIFDNITITPALSVNTSDTNCMISSAVHDLVDGQKKRKEHKKLKKLKELKEGKIKKKKDKKDKTKNKDKAEKYLTKQPAVSITVMSSLPLPLLPPPPPTPSALLSTTSTDNNQRQVLEALPAASSKTKGKDLSRKKEKKEKKKDKQRPPLDETNIMLSASSPSLPIASSTAMAMASKKDNMAMHAMTASELKKSKPANTSNSMLANSTGHHTHLPGLHSPSSNPVASAVPKLTLKLSNTQSPSQSEEMATPALVSPSVGTTHSAKLSPVRTLREPSPELARISPLVTRPPKHKLNTNNDLVSNGNPTGSTLTSGSTKTSLDLFGDAHKNNSATNVNLVVPPPSPWLSGGTISASSVLLPNQLLQSTKTHELTAGTTAGSSTGHGVDTSRQSTSNSERKSPLTTLIAESSRPSSYIDAEGNRVWICPACGKVDDGSPMIGCDGCDAWYHWICVGIVVAPKDNEDWFCRVCITRRKGVQGTEKKRKRTKKK